MDQSEKMLLYIGTPIIINDDDDDDVDDNSYHRQQVDMRNRRQIRRKVLLSSVNHLPFELRQKAWELIAFLDENKFTFTSSGSFVPNIVDDNEDGKPIGNIEDLLRYCLCPSSSEPEGFSKFLKQLKWFNVPSDLLHPSILRRRSRRNRDAPAELPNPLRSNNDEEGCSGVQERRALRERRS